MSEVTETHGFTQLKDSKVHYVWTINNFSLCFEEDLKILKSPEFPKNRPIGTVWQLSLHPGFTDNNKSVNLKLHLVQVAKHGAHLDVKFRFRILNDNNEQIWSTQMINNNFNYRYIFGTTIVIPPELKGVEIKSGNSSKLYEDKLIIFCEIISKAPENVLGTFAIPECNFLNNLENIFGNAEFSDVTLSAGGIDFPAHKVILAARSPVFKTMIMHNMQEKQDGPIEITDMDPEVLREMLHYMYTGKTFNMINTATDLLAAANKYGLDSLKVICGRTIYTDISSENAAEIFQAAQFYNVEELKMQTQTYILANLDQVSESESWISMKKTNPSIVDMIILSERKESTSTSTVVSSIVSNSDFEFLDVSSEDSEESEQ